MAKSTESMNPAVKCITMTVCSRVLYCSYYVASPAINLSLLIGNKSSLWWASQMLEIWSLQHHTWREDSNTRLFPSFIPSLLFFLGDRFNPGHMKHTLPPLVLNWSLSCTECQVLSCLALTKIVGLKALLVLQFNEHFTRVIFECLLFQIHRQKAEYLSRLKLNVLCVSQSNHEAFTQQVTSNTYMILNLNGPFETDRTTLFLEYFAEVEA